MFKGFFYWSSVHCFPEIDLELVLEPMYFFYIRAFAFIINVNSYSYFSFYPLLVEVAWYVKL